MLCFLSYGRNAEAPDFGLALDDNENRRRLSVATAPTTTATPTSNPAAPAAGNTAALPLQASLRQRLWTRLQPGSCDIHSGPWLSAAARLLDNSFRRPAEKEKGRGRGDPRNHAKTSSRHSPELKTQFGKRKIDRIGKE